jgi:hypothetical protein
MDQTMNSDDDEIANLLRAQEQSEWSELLIVKARD